MEDAATMPDAPELPDDPAALKALVIAGRIENADLAEEVAPLTRPVSMHKGVHFLDCLVQFFGCRQPGASPR